MGAWAEEEERWRRQTYEPFIRQHPERKPRFTTVSGLPLAPLYGPAPEEEGARALKLGFPGEYPYTRGVYPSMYRGRLWTRRQIAGFGTALATNERYRFLLAQGQTGLSTDFDHPTLTGYDSSDPVAQGEVGRLGVAIDTIQDMDDLFRDIPIDRVSVSFTINHPACVLLPMFVSVAESRGMAVRELRGTVQNDPLKEFYGQKTYALPPEPSVRLAIDVVEWCSREVPKWNAINVSGYHTREAGATAVQELAFTLGQGLAYAEALRRRGLDLNVAARNLSFFFGCHMDFFEEVAKFRAARRLWARILREEFGVQDARSLQLKFHTQTLGSTLARKGPKNNIIRGTLQALAAVLGGTQSLHVSGYDEAYDIPSEDAMRVALRTQQVIAYESGVADVVDPLGGSYLVEALTDQLEAEAAGYLHHIRDDLGGGSYLDGMMAGVRSGYFEREIARSAAEYQQKLETGELTWVGENAFMEDREADEAGVELFQFDETYEDQQKARLQAFLQARHNGRVREALRELRAVYRAGGNCIPAIRAAVRAGATEGEIMGLFREESGTYVDPAVY